MQASDGKGGLDVQSFTVIVTEPPLPANQSPSCEDTTITLLEDTSAVHQLACMDPDNGDPVTVEMVSPPAHGTAALWFGRVTYYPERNYDGPDQFAFKATDSHSAASAMATATITVNPVNDPPIAQQPKCDYY